MVMTEEAPATKSDLAILKLELREDARRMEDRILSFMDERFSKLIRLIDDLFGK